MTVANKKINLHETSESHRKVCAREWTQRSWGEGFRSTYRWLDEHEKVQAGDIMVSLLPDTRPGKTEVIAPMPGWTLIDGTDGQLAYRVCTDDALPPSPAKVIVVARGTAELTPSLTPPAGPDYPVAPTFVVDDEPHWSEVDDDEEDSADDTEPDDGIDWESICGKDGCTIQIDHAHVPVGTEPWLATGSVDLPEMDIREAFPPLPAQVFVTAFEQAVRDLETRFVAPSSPIDHGVDMPEALDYRPEYGILHPDGTITFTDQATGDEIQVTPQDGMTFPEAFELTRKAGIDRERTRLADSGAREVKPSGFTREPDNDKPDYLHLLTARGIDIVPAELIERIAEHYYQGGLKYAPHNWKRGTDPDSLERNRRSAVRHMAQWLAGDTTEDHLAAVAWNMITYEINAAVVESEAGD